ncbi:hypothetical protein ACI2KR_06455 [Pseudomonas luteola]
MTDRFEKWCESYGLSSEPNYSELTKQDCRAAWNEALANQTPIDSAELEDLARIEFESAMAFGISLDNFVRLAKAVSDRYTKPKTQVN